MTAHSPLQAVPQDTVNRNAPALPPTFLNLRVSHNELLTAELLRKQGPPADLAPRSPAASSRAPLNGHQPLMTAVRPHESTGHSELRQSGAPDGCGGGGDGDRDRHEGSDGEDSREGGDEDDPNHNPGTTRPRIRHRRGNGKTRAEPAESAGNKCPRAGADVQIRGPAGALERKSEVLGDGTGDAHRRNVSDGARVESETKVDIEAEVMMDAGRESGEDVSGEANHPHVGSDGAGPDEDVGARRDGGSPERVVDQGKGSAGGQEEEEVNGRGDAEDADALQDGAQGLRSFYGMRNTGGSDEDSSWTTLSQGSAVWSSPDDADELWDDCSHDEADPALPPGWKKIRDTSGTYYWHIPTGTTQWEPPSPPSATFPPATVPDNLDLHAESTHPDPSLKEFEGATLRYASLKLGGDMDEEEGDCMGCDLPCNPEAKCFAVRSLGWVEMSEEDLAPGRSSIAVNNCIRQLSYRKSDIRDTAGIWGEGKDMFLLLEKDLLTLVDPMDQGVLHSQPIINIRVWGVGRDNGRERDFAYVARDKLTRVLKCHVFRCDTPAKAIATSLHEICARIMAERRSAKSCASSCAAELGQQLHEAPLQVEFPTAKMESVQKFHVLYVGSMAVDRPAGKPPSFMGMEVLNDSIDALMAKSVKEDWEPVVINVAPATVAICKEKESRSIESGDEEEGGDEEEEEGGEQGDEVVFECRVRFLSFLGVGRDARSFAFIMAATPHRFECHAFWCEPNCAGLSEAVQAACVLRYQKCLDARPGALKPRGPSQPADSVARRVGCSVRKGVQSLFGSLRPRRSPLPDTP